MGRLVFKNTLYGFPVQFNVIAFFPFEDAFFFHLIEFGRQCRTCHVNVFGQLRKGVCQFHGRSAWAIQCVRLRLHCRWHR